jgi:hypothetical protein
VQQRIQDISREKVKEIKDIADANHGWNIVGWYRKGLLSRMLLVKAFGH